MANARKILGATVRPLGKGIDTMPFYFDSIRAPAEDFVVLPGVGHLAVVFARDAFLAALTEHVLPLVAAR